MKLPLSLSPNIQSLYHSILMPIVANVAEIRSTQLITLEQPLSAHRVRK